MVKYFLILFVLGLHAACSPVTQKIGLENRSPVLMNDRFISSDGTAHYVSRWGPEGVPKAIVIALHGFNDYRKAFEIPSAELTKSGLMVLAYDQRGFGQDERAGIWPKQTLLLNDLNEFSLEVRKKYPSKPIYILGESMGGAVALLHTTSNLMTFKPDGLVLVGPAVWGWSQMNVFYRVMLWFSAHLFPSWSPTGESLGKVPSDNYEMLRDLYEDPYVIKKTRIDAVYGLVSLMDDAFKAASRISIPTMVLYGEKDEIVPGSASGKFLKELPSDVLVKTYESGYHMLIRDNNRKEVLRDISEFILKKTNQVASASKE